MTALRAWRTAGTPELQKRNLGLAYVVVGERERSIPFLNQGHRLLAEIYPKFPRDPDVLASIAMVLFLKNQYADAVTLLNAAVAARSNDASLREKLAVALRAAGQREHAKQALEAVIKMDPSRETAYHLLAELQPNDEKNKQILERYLKWNPRSIVAKEALAKLAPP
jgi:tetratricopeptide (TPR) repeat protein